ncbi:MAG: alpha/beta fold hydrolase [Candidatus Kariarchaeaceae archaeon]|jgi:pimeloyl-ACP methyl ester carboxylesterase
MSILPYYQKIDGTDGDRQVPLFVIHTSPLDHNYMANSLPHDIKPNFDIYFVDLPAHGKSKDLEIKLSFRRLSDSIEELRKSLRLPKIHILGHGIGGFVAQYFAAYHKKFTASLIISNSSPNHNYREEMAWNIRDQYSNTVKQKLGDYEGRTDEESLKFKFKTALAYHFSPPNEEQANQIINSTARFASEAYVVISNYLIPVFDIRQYNQRIKVPVMIISGKNDVWPKHILEMYHTDIPNATYVEFETGHFPMVDKPEKFWNTLHNWLNKLDE